MSWHGPTYQEDDQFRWQQEQEEFLQWMDEHRHEESKPKQAPVKPDHTDGDCPF